MARIQESVTVVARQTMSVPAVQEPPDPVPDRVIRLVSENGSVSIFDTDPFFHRE